MKIEAQEKIVEELEGQIKVSLKKIGNVIHESVPVSKDEADNGLVRTWGEAKKDWKIDSTLGNLHHNEVMQILDAYDMEKGARIADIEDTS